MAFFLTALDLCNDKTDVVELQLSFPLALILPDTNNDCHRKIYGTGKYDPHSYYPAAAGHLARDEAVFH